MLVSNWAKNYWTVSTVAKKTLYGYRPVFGREVESLIESTDLNQSSEIDISLRGGNHYLYRFSASWSLSAN
jgi:hypothetical protein